MARPHPAFPNAIPRGASRPTVLAAPSPFQRGESLCFQRKASKSHPLQPASVAYSRGKAQSTNPKTSASTGQKDGRPRGKARRKRRSRQNQGYRSGPFFPLSGNGRFIREWPVRQPTRSKKTGRASCPFPELPGKAGKNLPQPVGPKRKGPFPRKREEDAREHS